MATIVVVGRLGSDGELRETQGGTKVISFSVADDVGYGDKKKTIWMKCALFGKRAESLAQYLTKGTLVEVTGIPQVSAWIDKKNAEARAQIEVSVNELKLHGGGKRDDAEPTAPKRGPRSDNNIDASDDIPF